LDVTLKFEMLEFREKFSLCPMDEVDLIFCDTFFEVHAVDVKRKPIQLVGTMIASR
jgi:hypothetical protein